MQKGDFIMVGSYNIYYVTNEPSRLYVNRKSKVWVDILPVLSSLRVTYMTYNNVDQMREERILEKEEVIKWIFAINRPDTCNQHSDLSRLK